MRKTVFLALLVFSSAAFSETTEYQFIDLGTLGGANSWASAINGLGQVVGRAEDASGFARAVLFDNSGGGANIDLGALADGMGESWAIGINNLGQIVGQDYDMFGMERAVLFDSSGSGSIISLGSLGGITGSAFAINDHGTIVGWSSTPLSRYGGGLWHATLFDATGGGANIDIDTTNSYSSAARCLNSSGLIAGSYETSGMVFDATDAGKNIKLGLYLSGSISCVTAVNASGAMVGYANNESGGYVHAASFAASATGASMIDLGGLGGTTSCALAINNKGQISGYGRAADGVNHAAIFDANGTGYNIDLNTLIAADSGWVLNSAYINDNGQICGWGTLASGETHAYLLIPPRKQVVVAATVALKPEKIRIDEVHGMWLMCTIRLPADYDVNTIDANSITLAENIESAIPIGGILKSEDAIRDFAVAAFEREAVASILHIGTLELVLSGKLADGTMFSGIASLKVEPKPVPRVKPAKKKLLKQAKKPTGKK